MDQTVYLEEMIKDLNVTKDIDKAALAAMVYECLRLNNCGVTDDNCEDVVNRLITGVCTRGEFEMLRLAAYWSNDLEILFCMSVGREADEHGEYNLYNPYIWDYIRKNEVVPGVRMVD